MPRQSEISTIAANAQADAFGALLDGGTLSIYTGSKPGTPQDAETGTLLGILGFDDPAFGAAVDGVITANPMLPEDSALASGQAGWFRTYSSTNQSIMDGLVGTENSDLNLTMLSIQAGDLINVMRFTHVIQRFALAPEDADVIDGGQPDTIFP